MARPVRMAQLSTPLTTQRLTLRPFVASDYEGLLRLYSDVEVIRYLYWEQLSAREVRERLQQRMQRPVGVVDDNVLPVAVSLSGSGEFVGDFLIRWQANEHRQGEIGGAVVPEFHSQGFATEIYEQLLELSFETYDFHRVFARCDARNVASIRSLAKAGLAREAHLVENEYVKGEWTNEVIMAIRQSQWRQNR